ncbi:hypothetical protein [Streptomyces sp. NPDC051997]|uniref:hypothetical protein n=1 Tax=Streptomyces sp. NPDC051997 TaxID=3155611 RepID=UPI003417B93E
MDRIHQPHPQPTPTNEATLRALLTAMAAHLTTEEPAEPMTERARLDLVRDLTDSHEAAHADLLARTVHVAPGATRRQYAEILRTVADGLDLVHRYAAAVERGRDLAGEIGDRHDEHPAWVSNQRQVAELFTKARDAEHTVGALMAATAVETR